MRLSLSEQEYPRLGQVNTAATCDFIEYLLGNPDQLAQIPEGSHLLVLDEQNRILAAQAETEGKQVLTVEGTRILPGAA